MYCCSVYFTKFALIFLVIKTINASVHNDYKHPEIIRHNVVKISYQTEEINAKNNNLKKYPSRVSISFPLDNEEVTLDLTQSTHLLGENFFRRTQDYIQKVSHEDIKLCHYKGQIRNKPNSWVAVSMCDGVSGVIHDGERVYHVEKKNDQEHFLYANERFKREATPINTTSNYNTQHKYVELILVVDNEKYKELGEDVEKVETYCINIVNIMNGIYSSLNVSIALVGVVTWTERNEIDMSSDGDTVLNKFLSYRKKKLNKDHPNDNAQLITKTVFSNGVLGKALKGVMCTYEYSGGITVDYSPLVSVTASSVAHILGHNFGMEHDSEDCYCPEERCIMSSSFSPQAPTQWSSCSLRSLKMSFEHGLDHCLKNKPQKLFKGPVCGNGIVEEGEECDCGISNFCKNKCCNADTCTRRNNATCAAGECCDLETCNLKTAGTSCRSATNECDFPEYCTGTSENCPENTYKRDTETCKNNNGYCFKGQCQTRSDQCRLLYGNDANVGEDTCFTLNTKGSRHGHCGYDKINQSYLKCNEEDSFCGALQCETNSTELLYGIESVAVLSDSFIRKKGRILRCRVATIDLGLGELDPGMVPNGSKCGDGKMCINQKCVSISNLETPICSHNCYKNGWCNNLGHCHCKPGCLLPHCEKCHSDDGEPA